MPEKIEIPPVFWKQIKNTVDRILKTPGNYKKGNILEMTVVIDKNLDGETVKGLMPELIRTLKNHDEAFRNVRFHIVYWETDERPEDRVLPMLTAASESFYGCYEQKASKKSVCVLAQYLTLFHARSKLILLLTDGNFAGEGKEAVKNSMQPFLEKKLAAVFVKEEGGRTPAVSYREW